MVERPNLTRYPFLLLETFVDPHRFHGTIYRASNWILAGSTRGYRHTREGYERTQPSKWVFILPLQRNARALLSRPMRNDRYLKGKTNMKLQWMPYTEQAFVHFASFILLHKSSIRSDHY